MKRRNFSRCSAFVILFLGGSRFFSVLNQTLDLVKLFFFPPVKCFEECLKTFLNAFSKRYYCYLERNESEKCIVFDLFALKFMLTKLQSQIQSLIQN